MSYAEPPSSLSRNSLGIGIVVLLHIVMIYGLANGLARKVVEVVKGPLETRIIREAKPPPPDAPPPPPPKLVPPPAFIPPPEISIAPTTSSSNAISAVTSAAPVAEAPKPVEAPKPAAVHVAPVVKAKSCEEPEYPAASERAGETGRVVLALLVGIDGKVVDSRIETSSGFSRLDEAARQALSLCSFQPGTADGKPEQAWGRIAYVFRKPDE